MANDAKTVTTWGLLGLMMVAVLITMLILWAMKTFVIPKQIQKWTTAALAA